MIVSRLEKSLPTLVRVWLDDVLEDGSTHGQLGEDEAEGGKPQTVK